ncbi:transcriptional regulator [Allopusillimonas soli]|uniref:Winged helix-turn-helix domain-containing protein n=1 Tax=Allopusillimonas soli TaxID=659016 RepID=A0A853F911_9BURK|nr:winged helix-turn-helix domain-containing protein [Allopusillimonas soli]TEA75606.1 transcriptional regulator [Allopusillimonas soli]
MPPEQDDTANNDEAWQFGSFVIWAQQRRVELAGRPIRLGPRSFDLLLFLVKRAGEFVDNRELLSGVWSGVVVEEASVRVHVSLIRKALGVPGERDGCWEWISNVPLHGYRFNGRLTRRHTAANTASGTVELPNESAFGRLPARMTPLVGREAEVKQTLSLIARHRLITVVGSGGIGKTSVALCTAARYRDETNTSVGFADLSPLVSSAHVPDAIARALGVSADLPDTLRAIIHVLEGRDILLLVDNCEHVVDRLAETLSLLLSSLPGLRVLATSREPLRLLGECVFRLPALALPDGHQASLEQLVRWPSVELLVARAQAAGAGRFHEDDARPLAKISRQLQGVPLAIELVAARLGTQSAADLAARLDDHLRMLSIANRGAADRHRSLAAALDWSMALLDQRESRMLRALAIFRGAFDTEGALALLMGESDPDDALDALASLVDKSLVMYDMAAQAAPYRLLDTTRAYAASLAAQYGEQDSLTHRHAAYMLDAMRAANIELPSLTEQSWGKRHIHRLDDLRFALRNCLSVSADAPMAASLVVASGPLWFQVSQLAEYRDSIVAALAALDTQGEGETEMKASLATTLLVAMLHTNGSDPGLAAVCDRAIAGAQTAGLRVLELQARWGRCTYDMFRGAYASALGHADKLQQVVQSWSDQAALNLAHRTSAMACHFAGEFELSRQHSEAALRMGESGGRTQTNMVGVDPAVAAKALFARTLWLQGHTGLALETATDAVARALVSRHTLSLCAALYGACPVALWSEEIDLARHWVGLMKDEARRRGLAGWLRFADWFHQGLLSATGNSRNYVLGVLDLLPGYDPPHQEMLLTFNVAWLTASLVDRAKAGEAEWCAAEILRGQGQRHLEEGDDTAAEASLRRAVHIARRQGARAWERRAAHDLARLLLARGDPRQAAQLIQDTCGSIFHTNDDRMLERLAGLHQRACAAIS